MRDAAPIPLEQAVAAWLEHLRDLGVEALRAPLPERPDPALFSRPPAGARRAPTPPAQAGARRPIAVAISPGPVATATPRLASGVPLRPVAAPAADAARREEAAGRLRQIREEIGDCKRCKLCQGRTHIVFGVGSPAADLLFIGEAPGHDEDIQGEPFVGRAGQLLTKIIEAMGMRRQDVYIANIVKCRPPGNRLPDKEEIAACQGFLVKQIEAIRPKIIVTLGSLAAQVLLRTEAPISRLRGMFREHLGTLVMPTFHPAFLLRDPNRKREVWEDMQKVRDRLAEMRRAASR